MWSNQHAVSRLGPLNHARKANFGIHKANHKIVKPEVQAVAPGAIAKAIVRASDAPTAVAKRKTLSCGGVHDRTITWPTRSNGPEKQVISNLHVPPRVVRF